MKIKNILTILAVFASSLVITFGLTACNNEPTFADHKVTVIDTVGNPIKDVIVKFIGKDDTSKTKVTDENGVAEYKNAMVGNFSIKIEAGLSTAVIETDEFDFEEGESELTVVLRNTETSEEIAGVSVKEGDFAGVVTSGEYNIPDGEKGMEFFVFRAKNSGTYRVSVVSSNSSTTVGYYGSPMYVLEDDIYKDKSDGKGYELIVQEAAAPYVIGVNRADEGAFVLKIERTGDAPFDPAFAPWTQIQSTETLEKCKLPLGTTLVDLDITDENLEVTLHDDGKYYTSDGKLVYIRLTTCSKYFDVEIARLVGQMDTITGGNFGGYVYDEKGDYKDKYSYNEMIISYLEKGEADKDGKKPYLYCDDVYGVYPLTEELANAVKHHGESTGWWTLGSHDYLFEGYDIVKENAWLFVCCVAE